MFIILSFLLGNFSYSMQENSLLFHVIKSCYSGQRKSLFHYSPKKGVIHLFRRQDLCYSCSIFFRQSPIRPFPHCLSRYPVISILRCMKNEISEVNNDLSELKLFRGPYDSWGGL